MLDEFVFLCFCVFVLGNEGNRSPPILGDKEKTPPTKENATQEFKPQLPPPKLTSCFRINCSCKNSITGDTIGINQTTRMNKVHV